ncbi:MAG: M14 family metallopeptidase, partial [Gemmatimonadota bacterium]
MPIRTLLLLGFILGTSSVGPAGAQDSSYDFRYHTYEESTEILQELAEAYPDLAGLYSIGTGVIGERELWCMEIGNQATGPAESKPAAYFDGNQHASEVTGGEVTLHLIHYLLSRYGTDPDVTRLLDTRVVYVIQRADPDGAEVAMTGIVDWDPAKAPGARDADGDGRFGEDGPEDVNGDGQILEMRIPDPDGEWKEYEAESRLMVRREEGDTQGTFYRVLSEGFDNDGDGQVNEDAPNTGFISNRNYPAYWASTDARFRGGGDYPLQEHNARLLVDFILSKPHISQ